MLFMFSKISITILSWLKQLQLVNLVTKLETLVASQLLMPIQSSLPSLSKTRMDKKLTIYICSVTQMVQVS
jgi:hypothetical protein